MESRRSQIAWEPESGADYCYASMLHCGGMYEVVWG